MTTKLQTLQQKVDYYEKEVPKLRKKLDQVNLLAEKQREETRTITALYDQLQRDFDVMAGMKMRELLDGYYQIEQGL